MQLQSLLAYLSRTFTKNLKMQRHLFFIGGYRYDGSKLYIDSEDGKVHFCKRRDASSLLAWDSFEDMLLSESKRIFTLYDDRGRMLAPSEKTLPI